jgi:hypothetical protein
MTIKALQEAIQARCDEFFAGSELSARVTLLRTAPGFPSQQGEYQEPIEPKPIRATFRVEITADDGDDDLLRNAAAQLQQRIEQDPTLANRVTGHEQVSVGFHEAGEVPGVFEVTGSAEEGPNARR